MKNKKIYFTIFILIVSLIISGCSLNNFTLSLKEKESYPVIVIGSTPEAVAAAVASARTGTDTLLIDTNNTIGGLITLGKLNTLDMNYGPNNELLTQGIFLEFFKLNDKKTSLDIEEAQAAFNKLINDEPQLDTILGVKSILPIKEGGQLSGIHVEYSNGETKSFYGSYFIDATENADFAYLAGEEFTIGQEDFGGPKSGMAVTQIFELTNVDWDAVSNFLNDDNNPHTGADSTSAWGYSDIMKGFKAEDPNIRMRGLNIGRQNNGNVLINAMHIFGVDGLDEVSLTEAVERAEREMPNIVAYLNKYAPGFENAQFVQLADQLYVRETRHLKAMYRLTIDDVMEHRNFEDKIALGSYPIDIQATSMNDWGNIAGNPEIYSIPFRSLVPMNNDNLLVVGRSAGYDSLAAGTTRVIPVGMATGEAAGVAAAYGNDNSMSIHEIASSKQDITNIQNQIKDQGAYLEEFDVPSEITKHWAYDGVKFLRQYNLLTGDLKGGYNNDYRLEELITEKQLFDLVEQLSNIYSIENPLINEEWRSNSSLTLNKLLPYLPEIDIVAQPIQVREAYAKPNDAVTRGVAYTILKEWFE